LSNAENLLDSEFQTAFALIKDKDPDDLPKLDGTAPWTAVAEEQLKDWTSSLKKETTPQGKARIIEYFASFGAKANGTEAWCGAFVGYCLEKCEPSFATTVPKDAGWAPNWVNWGNVSVPPGQPEIPKGAIVTISPGGDTKNISHVGFCDSSDSKQVKLLGGNQTDTVNISPFPRSRIAAIRWFSQAESDAGRTADLGRPGKSCLKKSRGARRSALRLRHGSFKSPMRWDVIRAISWPQWRSKPERLFRRKRSTLIVAPQA
jgi:uncharacterized protein (TIGR02594 family)